jgi:hypothetical protein
VQKSFAINKSFAIIEHASERKLNLVRLRTLVRGYGDGCEILA